MSKDKKVSLGELMGKGNAECAGKMSLKDLPDMLGEGLPEMDHSPVGRIRLIRALKQRFGDNFRSLPGLKNIVKEFDDAADFEIRVNKLKAVKYAKGKKNG